MRFNKDLCKDCDIAMQAEALCEICQSQNRYKNKCQQLQAEKERLNDKVAELRYRIDQLQELKGCEK